MCYIPIKSSKYFDYFEIPNFSRYVINEDGSSILNKASGRKMSFYEDRKGYYNTSTFSDDITKSKTTKIHRLVAAAFYGPPPVYENDTTTVNHIDGIKTNNHYTNLEWCTQTYNNQHAVELGLLDSTKIPFICRHELTNIEIKYNSLVEGASATGVDISTLKYRLKCGQNKIWPGYLRYKYIDDVFEIIREEDFNKHVSKFEYISCIYVYSIKNKQEIRYASIREYVEKTNENYEKILNRLNRGPDKVWPGYLRYRKESDVFATLTEQEINDSLKSCTVIPSLQLLVKWADSDIVEVFKNKYAFAEKLNVGYGVVTRFMDKKELQLVYWVKGYPPFQIQYANMNLVWRPIDDIYNELKITAAYSRIFVIEFPWGVIKETHETIRECARNLGVKEATLGYRLMKDDGWIKDDKRYIRELDYYKHFGRPLWTVI